MLQGSRFSGSGQCWGRLRPGQGGGQESVRCGGRGLGHQGRREGNRRGAKASVKMHLSKGGLRRG